MPLPLCSTELQTFDKLMVNHKLPPGYLLTVLDKVDSTNAEARRRAEDGAPDGTMIQGITQTEGRGRRGRRWESPRGNLYMSLILKPDCSVVHGLSIAFVSAIAMYEALASIVPPMVEINVKWPNDILVNGRKVAGILLESSSDYNSKLRWLVLGVGVNIKSFPEDTEYPATSLNFEGAMSTSATEVLCSFARHFKRWLNMWMDEGFPVIRTAWLQRAAYLGKRIEVRLPNERFSGRFLDIDERGCLIVEVKNGDNRSVSVGDIFPPEIR